MKSPDSPDIRTLELNELLDQLEVRAHRPETDFDKWLVEQDVFPGTSRVRCVDLYEQYRTWWMNTPGMTEKLLDIRSFGKHMTRRFKAGKSKLGQVYYISRQREVVISPSLQDKG